MGPHFCFSQPHYTPAHPWIRSSSSRDVTSLYNYRPASVSRIPLSSHCLRLRGGAGCVNVSAARGEWVWSSVGGVSSSYCRPRSRYLILFFRNFFHLWCSVGVVISWKWRRSISVTWLYFFGKWTLWVFLMDKRSGGGAGMELLASCHFGT